MHTEITLSPQRRDDALTLEHNGDVYTVNDEAFDFSGIPDGATLPQDAVACEWLAGDVSREGGVLRFTLILPVGPDAPEAARFPAPISDLADGPIPLPTDIEEPAQ